MTSFDYSVRYPYSGKDDEGGTIRLWYLVPGNRMEEGQGVVEILAARQPPAWDPNTRVICPTAPVSGTVTELLAFAGDFVSNGSPLCLVQIEDVYDVLHCPNLGEGRERGTLARWLGEPPGEGVGFSVSYAEIQCGEGSEATIVHAVSPVAGVITERLAAVGDVVSEGSPLCRVRRKRPD